VNVIGAGGALQGMRIFEFDTDGRLCTRIEAAQARWRPTAPGRLQRCQRTDWPQARSPGRPAVRSRPCPPDWPSTLDRRRGGRGGAAAELDDDDGTVALQRHLDDQARPRSRPPDPLLEEGAVPAGLPGDGGAGPALRLPACARAGSVSLKVFGGIMLGISFVLLNNLAGHIGMLRDWTPWVVAAAPSLLYLLLSMAAFAWLVRYR
jgi:lipopolysaccharide export system permease protein